MTVTEIEKLAEDICHIKNPEKYQAILEFFLSNQETPMPDHSIKTGEIPMTNKTEASENDNRAYFNAISGIEYISSDIEDLGELLQLALEGLEQEVAADFDSSEAQWVARRISMYTATLRIAQDRLKSDGKALSVEIGNGWDAMGIKH